MTEKRMTEETTPLLSLCIPTYNRAALLSQSLRAILSQITPDMNSAVEVVTIDNASPDDTPAVVAQAQRDFPHVTLRAVRRPQNIGCDANFCDAPNQARGAWVYLLSDDDVLLPGAVAALLGLIAAHPDVDAFALNVREFRQTPDEPEEEVLYLGVPIKRHAFRLAEAEELFPDADSALAFLRMHIAFLSCIAFRRASVAGRDYASRYHTNLAQAYMFLDALAPGHGLYAVAHPYLSRRTDNNEGFDFFRVFVTNVRALLRHARTLGYSEAAVREATRAQLAFIYDFVLVFKEQGGYGKLRVSYAGCLRAAVRLLRAYGSERRVLGQIIPRLLVPASVFVGVKRAYQGLRGPHRASPAILAVLLLAGAAWGGAAWLYVGRRFGSVPAADAPPAPLSGTPRLSLCLPTYNRAALLTHALRAILSQITPDMNSAVEVVTLDNASPDDTPAIIAQAQRDFPHVTFRAVRHAENIGPDANFTEAVRQARGEFVYLLSDDDVLLPGAVAALLELIAEHPDFDAFALNIRHFLTDPDVDLAPVRVFEVEEDRVFRGRDKALGFLQTHITFMSSMAFRRESVAGRDYRDKVGSIIIQAYFFLDALAPGRGLYLTREAFLAQRTDNVGGYDFYKVFVTHFDQVLRYAGRAGYARRIVRQMRARHLRYLSALVLIFKVRGSYGTLRPDHRDGIRRMWRAYGPHPYFLGVLLPLLLLPTPLVAIVKALAHGARAVILRRPRPPRFADPR